MSTSRAPKGIVERNAPSSSYRWGEGPREGTAEEAAPTRVLLIGDQHLYRSALRSLIERVEGYQIVAETSNDPLPVEEALQREVDLVLIDYDLESTSAMDFSNFEALLYLIAPRPSVILSSGLEPEACYAALRAGSSGIVLKARGGDSLLEAMDSARRGQVCLEREVLTQMFADSSHTRRVPCVEQDKINQLTPREREIVKVACLGLTNKQIGDKLAISEATVRHHLGSIFAKLGVSTRSELVVYSYRHHLMELRDLA